jgi:GxxExxY protein
MTQKQAEKAGRMTQKTILLHKELTEVILAAFFAVYNALGYGFLESVYANALALELLRRGLTIQREMPVEVQFLGQSVGAFRMDMVANGTVIIEIKAGAAMVEADERQLFNYLRASSKTVGLLLHFGPRPQFKRLVWTGRHFET